MRHLQSFPQQPLRPLSEGLVLTDREENLAGDRASKSPTVMHPLVAGNSELVRERSAAASVLLYG